MQNVWAGRSELLHEAIGRSLDAIEFSHGQLMREQVEASDPAAYEPAALACLAAAEAAGGTARAALPGAVSIALMSQMALVFMGLENSGGAASLSTAWGMPRSLNAGDAMFAVAQDSLLVAADELRPDERLQATRILDGGARALVDGLLDAAEGDVALVGQRTLLPAAMALGGLLGRANPETRERLQALGQAWAVLPADELSKRLAGDPHSWLAT